MQSVKAAWNGHTDTEIKLSSLTWVWFEVWYTNKDWQILIIEDSIILTIFNFISLHYNPSLKHREPNEVCPSRPSSLFSAQNQE